MIGTIISHYRITAKLGQGGMGEVYRAEDTRLGRQVALKLMTATAAAPAEETWERELRGAAEERASEADRLSLRPATDPRSRFLREARTVSALNHPGIVTIYDVGEWQGRLFIAMELVEGETLRKKLDLGSMNTKSIIKMAMTMAEALQRAHAAGVVHRDIKPENIIISTEGQTKLLDFGIAKLRNPEKTLPPDVEAATVESLTLPGFILGTIHYMSPEQAQSQEIDHRSDLFSLGSVLYESFAGHQPFSGSNVDALFAILHYPPAPIRQYDSNISSDLEGIVEKLMEKDREERYQSAAELLVDLRRAERRLSPMSTAAFRLPPGVPDTVPQAAPLPGVAQGRGGGTIQLAHPIVDGPRFPPPRASKWVLAVVPAAAAMLGALAMFLAMPQFKPAPSKTQTYPVTHLHKSISQPALSPDGKLITFISGDNQVYVALASSGEATQLTKSGDTNAYPRFSSDGSRILFHRINAEDLWEVPALGGEAHRVLAQARFGAWSPDGAHLAYSRTETVRGEIIENLYVGDARGGNPRKLAGIEAFPNVFPVWTPDSRKIVYMEAYQQRRAPRLQVADADGASPPRTLVSDNLISQPPAVSPDGRWVYYSAVKDGLVNLWRVELPTSAGQPQQVTFSIGEDRSPALDPAGWLYYVTARHRSRLQMLEESGTKLLADDTLVVNAQLSPDDRHVAFVRPQWSGTVVGELMVLDREGGHTQRVETPGLVTAPCWSPDGKRLGYSSRAAGFFQAYVTDLETGRTTPAPPSPGRHTMLRALSPSGELLIERMAPSGITGAAAVFDPASGKERLIAQGVNAFGFSNDGKWVGLHSLDDGAGGPATRILLVPAQGGEPHPVFQGVAMSPLFARDSPRIIFMTRQAPPQFSSIAVNDGLGGPPEPYVSQVLLEAFTEFGPQAVMDFDFAHQRALVSVNESDMDIVRRKANP